MSKVKRFMRNNLRSLLTLLVDCLTVLFLYTCSFFVCRLNIVYNDEWVSLYLYSLAVIIPIYIIVFMAMGIYRSLWTYAQPREYLLCNFASLLAGMLFFFASRFIIYPPIPFYFYILVMCMVAIGLVGFRLIYRVYRLSVTPKKNNNCKRVLIVGCGNACEMLLNEIRNTPGCMLDPIVGVDSDESKSGRVINRLRIEGTNADIERLAKKHRIDLIIVAIPSADNKKRAEILDLCTPTGCEVKMLPRLYDFHATNESCIQKLRNISPEELLGREPVLINNDTIADLIEGHTVMITGGGGSIGSELCRQIAAFSPRRLVIVDIYENNAYDIQQELVRKYGKTLNLEVCIASVRDREHIFSLMRRIRPEIVIHAAAHKHVPLMESSPAEAVKNNIFGTLNTAEAAIENGVNRFIMISTDKAVNPTNIMGCSKRVCELIIDSLNGRGTEFCAVRFGNVLGSNGSVIPLFKKQIEEGGPVTVTHRDITRFFMTIPEAVQLVLAAGSMAKGGEVFVLEMGEPVKIDDLARKMIQLAGYEVDRDITVKYTGLRPGEKLYEEVMTKEEGTLSTSHDKILIGNPRHADKAILAEGLERLYTIAHNETMPATEQAAAVAATLAELVPEFHHNVND